MGWLHEHIMNKLMDYPTKPITYNLVQLIHATELFHMFLNSLHTHHLWSPLNPPKITIICTLLLLIPPSCGLVLHVQTNINEFPLLNQYLLLLLFTSI